MTYHEKENIFNFIKIDDIERVKEIVEEEIQEIEEESFLNFFLYKYLSKSVDFFAYRMIDYFCGKISKIDSDFFARIAMKSNSKVLKIIMKHNLGQDLTHAFLWAAFEENFDTMLCIYEAAKGSIKLDILDGLIVKQKFEKLLQIFERTKVRAQKKIYFWVIPLIYDINRESGKRLRQKNYEKYLKF